MAHLTPPSSSSSPFSLNEHRLICRVCYKQFSQYTCPRCNLRYCSLSCYKSHSVRCVESFMRDNVVGEMHNLRPEPETKRHMMEVLKRFHMGSEEEGSLVKGGDDDMDVEGENGSTNLSESTLEKITSGEHIEFDDLTPEEKKSFLRAVASGELSHMIKPWDPWWLNPSARKLSVTEQGNCLVQPIDKQNRREFEDHNATDASDIPAPLESPLLSVKQLTSLQPSPLLGIHLVEVVYSYCFTLRLFNGDWHTDALDAAASCLTVSQVLGRGESPESLRVALGNCLEIVSSASFKSAGGHKFALALLDDVLALLHLGRPGIICMFADLSRLLESAIEKGKEESKAETGQQGSIKSPSKSVKLPGKARSKGVVTAAGKPSSKIARTDLKRLHSASRKVYFLMCWTNEQPNDFSYTLALLVEGEKTCLVEIEKETCNDLLTGMARASHHSQQLCEKNDSYSRKHLIQEL